MVSATSIVALPFGLSPKSVISIVSLTACVMALWPLGGAQLVLERLNKQTNFLQHSPTDQTLGERHATESNEDSVKVLFGIFTAPTAKHVKQLNSILETWATEVKPGHLMVIGVHGSVPGVIYNRAPECADGHIQNDGVTCKEATVISMGYKLGADWVVGIGSDVYVFPKRFHQVLKGYDPVDPQILSIPGCGKGLCDDGKGGLSGLCGGGGYAVSRGALDKMVHRSERASETYVEEMMRTARSCGNWSDITIGCVARRYDVRLDHLPGLYANLLAPVDDQYWFGTIYFEKILSSEVQALSFHYMNPEKMHAVHRMTKVFAVGSTVHHA